MRLLRFKEFTESSVNETEDRGYDLKDLEGIEGELKKFKVVERDYELGSNKETRYVHATVKAASEEDAEKVALRELAKQFPKYAISVQRMFTEKARGGYKVHVTQRQK